MAALNSEYGVDGDDLAIPVGQKSYLFLNNHGKPCYELRFIVNQFQLKCLSHKGLVSFLFHLKHQILVKSKYYFPLQLQFLQKTHTLLPPFL